MDEKSNQNQTDDAPEGESRGDPDVVEYPIDGVLDLHGFNPKEIKDLLPVYIAECQKRGIVEIRIIHGKGKGVLRRIVHAALQRSEAVKGYRLAGHGSGSWGATLADLHPPMPGT